MPAHLTYLAGREAVAAWRALPTETKRWCQEAASSGEPLTDLDLASTVTGYGHAMVHRNRRLLGLASAGVFVLSGTLASWARHAAPAIEALFWLAVLGCVGVILVRARPHLRYRALRFWGLAALEEAHTAAASPAVEPPAVTGIRFHRARMLSVILAAWAVVLALAALAGYLSMAAEWLSAANLGFGALCVVLVLILGSDVRRQRQYLQDPTFVRLTHEGWEFPGTGMRGEWSEVHGIEVRTGPAVGPRLLFHPGMRIVLLQVHDPQRLADNAHPLRRREAQADYGRYGSPAAFSVSYFFTISASDALKALRQYTAAPITWRGAVQPSE